MGVGFRRELWDLWFGLGQEVYAAICVAFDLLCLVDMASVEFVGVLLRVARAIASAGEAKEAKVPSAGEAEEVKVPSGAYSSVSASP